MCERGCCQQDRSCWGEIDSFSNVIDRFGVEAEFYAHNFAADAWPMVVDDAPETEVAFNLIAQLVSKNTT